MPPWQEEMGCIPPRAEAAFVARMEDLLEWDQLPYDPRRPVVGRDEMPKQLLAETGIPWPVSEGQPVRYDYEYGRKGACNSFLFVEPLRGWKAFVRDRRTKVDRAECVRVVLDEIYPRASGVRLVQDNLNTHPIGSLYGAFAPEEARRLAPRLEIHPTPVHGSWLSMAEAELSLPERPCRDRRLDATEVVRKEVGVWETRRTRRNSPSTGGSRPPRHGSS